MFFWFTFNKSRVAFNKATKASQIAQLAMKGSEEANRNLVKALNNQIEKQANLILSITSAYEIIANQSIKQKLTLMEISSPTLTVSQELFYKMDELKVAFQNGTIDIFHYYAEVNQLIDHVQASGKK